MSSHLTSRRIERVVAYVDGFNLYFGLKSKGWRHYYWLDVPKLIRRLLLPSQQLIETKYFTSRVSGTPSDPDKPKRQNTYLEALQSLPALTVFFGHYLPERVECRRCGAIWPRHAEKMTDVNIATEMLIDAFQDRYDTALLVSGDSDLVGPVEKVRSLFPSKRVVVAFPPNRKSERLTRSASSCFVIGRAKFADSQLPDEITKPDGFTLKRPNKWK